MVNNFFYKWWVFGLSGSRTPALTSGPRSPVLIKFQQAQSPPSQSPVTMIMCALLSMVYGLFKQCRLTHDTKDITSLMSHIATCFKETVLLFNVHLSFFMDSIRCQTDKYMSKVNYKQIRLIC